MKNCIIESKKIKEEVISLIKNMDKWWFFWNRNITFNEMKLLKPIIIISNQLQFIDFGLLNRR